MNGCRLRPHPRDLVEASADQFHRLYIDNEQEKQPPLPSGKEYLEFADSVAES